MWYILRACLVLEFYFSSFLSLQGTKLNEQAHSNKYSKLKMFDPAIEQFLCNVKMVFNLAFNNLLPYHNNIIIQGVYIYTRR